VGITRHNLWKGRRFSVLFIKSVCLSKCLYGRLVVKLSTNHIIEHNMAAKTSWHRFGMKLHATLLLTYMFHIDTAVRTRGHSLKLVKCRCNKDSKFFFFHRVVSKWNMLNNDSVTAKTVNGFKTKLER